MSAIATGSRRWLIVNADDFGASRGVNQGICEAHDAGVVSLTSLMVTMPAAEEAVELARQRPGLSLGRNPNSGAGPTIVRFRAPVR